MNETRKSSDLPPKGTEGLGRCKDNTAQGDRPADFTRTSAIASESREVSDKSGRSLYSRVFRRLRSSRETKASGSKETPDQSAQLLAGSASRAFHRLKLSGPSSEMHASADASLAHESPMGKVPEIPDRNQGLKDTQHTPEIGELPDNFSIVLDQMKIIQGQISTISESIASGSEVTIPEDAGTPFHKLQSQYSAMLRKSGIYIVNSSEVPQPRSHISEEEHFIPREISRSIDAIESEISHSSQRLNEEKGQMNEEGRKLKQEISKASYKWDRAQQEDPLSTPDKLTELLSGNFDFYQKSEHLFQDEKLFKAERWYEMQTGEDLSVVQLNKEVVKDIKEELADMIKWQARSLNAHAGYPEKLHTHETSEYLFKNLKQRQLSIKYREFVFHIVDQSKSLFESNFMDEVEGKFKESVGRFNEDVTHIFASSSKSEVSSDLAKDMDRLNDGLPVPGSAEESREQYQQRF